MKRHFYAAWETFWYIVEQIAGRKRFRNMLKKHRQAH